MNDSEISIDLHKEFQKLKSTLQTSKINLINLNLNEIFNTIRTYFSSWVLNELFLEFLIKLSEVFYWKSCFLLNIINKFSENLTEELKQELYRKEEMVNEFMYYKALPLEKCLYKKIFLSQNFVEPNFREKELYPVKDKTLILKGILSILNKERKKKEFLFVLSERSIKYYLKKAKHYLQKKFMFSFKELVNEEIKVVGKDNFLEVIYYFLAFLFLYFERACIMIQNRDTDDIVIFSKQNR